MPAWGGFRGRRAGNGRRHRADVQTLYKDLAPAAQTMAYASLYNTIFFERNVGNIQASVSFSVAVVSLVIGLLQVAGLDLYLKAFVFKS